MSFCLDCGMELPDASCFCAHCGHGQNSTSMNPTRISNSLATLLHPSDASMMSSETLPKSPRRKEEDDKQHRPLAPPILLFGGQASSGSVPIVAGIPLIGALPRVSNLLSRVALTCDAAAKLALTPWIVITLVGITMFVGAGMAIPHELEQSDSTRVSAYGDSHHQVVPVPMQSGETDCIPAGNARIYEVGLRYCTSLPGKVSGKPVTSQQEGTAVSNSSSSPVTTAVLPQVTNGKLQNAVPSPAQSVLNSSNAVLNSTVQKTPIGSVLNKTVPTVSQVVRSVVNTSTSLPQNQNTLNKSVSAVQQVVRSVVNTSTSLPQVGNTLNKSVSTVQQVVQGTVRTATQQSKTVLQTVVSKTVSQQSQVVQTTLSNVKQQARTLQSTVVNTAKQQTKVVQSTASSVKQPSQVVQSTVNTLTQQPNTVQSTASKTTTTVQPQKTVQNTVSTATVQQQPLAVQNAISTSKPPQAVQSTISITTTKQQPEVGNTLSNSTPVAQP